MVMLLFIFTACGVENSTESPVDKEVQRSAVGGVHLHFEDDRSALLPGEWRWVEVATNGTDFADLDFEIQPNDGGNKISVFRGPEFNPTTPRIIVAAGWKPGQYEIHASEGGHLLGVEPFELSFETNDPVDPNMWLEGDSRTRLVPYAQTFDEDPRGYINAPQIGERNVLIIPVEFSDARFDPSLDLMPFLHESFVDGRPHPFAAGKVSVVSYWLEVSGRKLKFRPFIQDIVQLNRRTPVSSDIRGLDQQVVSALGVRGLASGYADGFTQQDWATLDAIAFVFPGKRFDGNPSSEVCDGLDNDLDGTADNDPSCQIGPMLAVCGDGLISPGEECDSTVDDFFDDGCFNNKGTCSFKKVRIVWPSKYSNLLQLPNGTSKQMPLVKLDARWQEYVGGTTPDKFTSVAIHEFGHLLGLPDNYLGSTPSMASLDIMDAQDALPSLNLSDRLRLNWVDPSQVPLMDNNSPFLSSYDISPLNLLTYPDDNLGIEFKLAPGHSIFWSMRTSALGAITDRYFQANQHDSSFFTSPLEKLFVGTDRITNYSNTSISRAPVIMAPPDFSLSGSGRDLSRIKAGETWEMSDANDFMILSVEPTNITTNSAVLNVAYRVADPARIPGADLNIRPWPSENARYQSPDIEVRSPAWILNEPETHDNTPKLNARNKVVVTVHNSTDIPAFDVEVSVSVVPYGTGNPVYDLLGKAVIDEVPANGQATATLYWRPDGSYDHVCLKAQITPNNIHDDETNNIAKSNYISLASGSSSPGDLNEFGLTVTNFFDHSTIGYPIVSVDESHFRTFLDRRSVALDPGQSKEIGIRYHFIGDFAAEFGETLFNIPETKVDMTAEFDVLEGGNLMSVPSLEGATAKIRAGFKTYVQLDRIPSVNPNEPIHFDGIVTRVTDDSPVPDGGKLLACIWRDDIVADECEQILVHHGEWSWSTIGPWTKADFQFITNGEDLASPILEVQP
jgi:hypothetical protein